MNTCSHQLDGICSKCSENKPYMIFQYCKDKCCKCNYCGYHWGAGYPVEGERGKLPHWMERKKENGL